MNASKKLFLNLKILDFDKNYEYKIGIFMYKLDNNLLPKCICSMLQTLDNDKGKLTSRFVLQSVETNFGNRFITFKGIIICKVISKILRDKNTITLFSKY